jgi:signal transduction histidine kinase/CheY-like chemotaxis protein
VLAGGAVIALVILGLTAAVIYRTHNREQRDAYNVLRSMDLLLAEQTVSAFKNVDLVLDEVSSEIMARGVQTSGDLDREMAGISVHQELDGKIAGVPQLDAVTVIDADGRLVNFSRYFPVPPVNVSDRDYFVAMHNATPGQRSFISQPVDNRGTGTRTIYVARRLSGPDGQFVGLVLGAIQTEWFREVYDGVRESSGLAISLWRSDGNLLVRAPAAADTPAAQHLPPDLLPLIKPGEPNLFRTMHGSPVMLLVATTMALSYPLVVSVTEPQAVALSDWQHDSYAIGTVGATCAVLVMVLTLMLVRQFGVYERIHDALRARDTAERGREEAELQLRQAQKMEAIGQLTAGLAHDFNNLLLSMMGGVEQLERELGPGPGRRALELIRRAADRATAVTRQLLAFSRQSLLQPQALALDEVLAAIRPLLVSSLGPSVSLEMRLPAGLWPVFADAGQVERVVLNLVLNARDAMPTGGRVWIEGFNLAAADTDATRPAELPPGDHVCIVVRDTGTGMMPEVVARAFDPFFTTKPQGKGTGLGLSQVYGVARQSGGGVLVESEPGLGTSMTVFLPRSSSMPAQPRDDSLAPGQLPEVRVLVVDDDPLVREAVMNAVAVLGCRPEAVEDGDAAVRLLRCGTPPDVVLLDYAMPGMNGSDTARAIRAMAPDLPIVFMTGHADPAPLAGERWLLVKPFRSTQLARILGEAVSVTSA